MKSKFVGTLSLLVFTSVIHTATARAASSSCPAASLRWVSTSNTIYIAGASTVCTPAELSAAQSAHVVGVGASVYLVRSNIMLTNGATLQVIGTAAGGDTNELRLLSNNKSSSTAFVNITADWGRIRFDTTNVTSWNESSKGPDTETSTYGRAFVRVRSRYVNNMPLTSRMDIAHSDIGFLGYHAAESYGLAWRVMGATATDKSVYNKVDVLGSITRSRLHNNYFGAYTFGAYGMLIDSNEFDHNIKYGLDPHDDSDSLTITNNRSHDNGDHGIICAERCDHLIIQNNQSYNNVGHGIMLYRSVDYCLVEGNAISNNTDTGIVLFESNNDTVRSNILTGNKTGIRLSLGSSYDVMQDNMIKNSRSIGLYTYKGSDAPERPGNDGISRYNEWTGNTVQVTSGEILKLNATDHDTFDRNDFRNNPAASFDLSGATNTKYTNNLVDPGVHLP